MAIAGSTIGRSGCWSATTPRGSESALRNRLRQADFQAKDDQGDDCPGRRLDGGRRFRMGKIIGQIMAEELEKLVPDLAPYIK